MDWAEDLKQTFKKVLKLRFEWKKNEVFIFIYILDGEERPTR